MRVVLDSGGLHALEVDARSIRLTHEVGDKRSRLHDVLMAAPAMINTLPSADPT